MFGRHTIQNVMKRSVQLRLSNNFKSLKYGFSTMKSEMDSKDKLELIRKQPWFQQYQLATKYNSQQNFTDALRHYYKVIQLMEERNQKGQAYYYRMFERVLKLNVVLNRPLETEQNLYRLIKVKKAVQKNPILVYEDYQNLMIHQLNHNVEKAIKLGKALLSESQINNLPINNEKHIRMLLGNAYLLVENYPDAKRKYGEVLEMKPSHTLRGMTFNNLAVASWWHKNPMFPSHASKFEYEEVRINRDFNQTKELLMNSIGALQNIDQMSQKQAISLESLLNQNPDSMMGLSSKSNRNLQAYSFEDKHTLKPLYNLIQYYIYNDPIQKPLIMAWIRILLKTAAKFHNTYLIDELTAKYYLLNNQVEGLTNLLQTLHNKYEQAQKAKEHGQKSKVFKHSNHLMQKFHSLQLYKMMGLVKKLSPTSEFGIEVQKVNSLEKQLLQKDPFIFKRQFLLSEEMSFMQSESM